MAAVRRNAAVGVVLGVLLIASGAGVLGFGCDDLSGLEVGATAVARIRVRATGDLAALQSPQTKDRPPRLRAALVWGDQWLPEPFCILPAESDQAARVIEAGCPDSFRFVPRRVGANVALANPTSASASEAALELFSVPAADVMVGDVSARIAYGSIVIYDDRNDNDTLDLRRPPRIREHDHAIGDGGVGGGAADAGVEGEGDAGVEDLPDDPTTRDVIYGTSFLSMTRADQRVAFREGAFDESAAFYPRVGCPAPPLGFSILSAGGFSATAAIAAALQGKLPAQDAETCRQAALEQGILEIPLQQPSTELKQVACRPGQSHATPHYREPPAELHLADRVWACAGIATLGGDPPPIRQLVVASAPEERCRYVTHFILRGCRHDPGCKQPEWDRTASAPAWWPCDQAAP